MGPNPYDARDERERADVATILGVLPEEHPARVAYRAGAREAADSIGLGHLLVERMDLVRRLTDADLAHDRRINACYAGGSWLTGSAVR